MSLPDLLLKDLQLRNRLSNIESLRDIFYYERFIFIHFVKCSSRKLKDVKLDDALHLMHGYFKCTSDLELNKPQDEDTLDGYKKIAHLL